MSCITWSTSPFQRTTCSTGPKISSFRSAMEPSSKATGATRRGNAEATRLSPSSFASFFRRATLRETLS